MSQHTPAATWPSEPERARARQSDAPDLIPRAEADELVERWESIKAGFVDDPRAAVVHADQLVGELLEHLKDAMAREHHTLGEHWQGEGRTTEDLRLALGRYRALVDRLLALAR
jgi:hypothetical protein